jgi:hypothetical protein
VILVLDVNANIWTFLDQANHFDRASGLKTAAGAHPPDNCVIRQGLDQSLEVSRFDNEAATSTVRHSLATFLPILPFFFGPLQRSPAFSEQTRHEQVAVAHNSRFGADFDVVWMTSSHL